MAFEKGHPGGPGRPKQKPFLDWCKTWTVEKAHRYLRPIAENGKRKDQLEAIKLIMAYGVGKPVESIEASHQFDGVEQNPSSIAIGLAELIERGRIASVVPSNGNGEVATASAIEVPGPERGAGESNP